MSSEKFEVVIRLVEAKDYEEVQIFWYAGFMELVWDLTATLAPVYLGETPFAYLHPRSIAAIAAVSGGVHAVASEYPLVGVVGMLCGMTLTAVLHVASLVSVDTMSRKDIYSGDMSNINKEWVVDGKRAFYIAEVGGGRVVGSVAVKRGGVKDYYKRDDETTDEPGIFSVWKLSTDSSERRGGVAMQLMKKAELWAMEHGASKIRLMTGSVKAKTFYKRIGYSLYDGSRTGARLSFWEKALG